MEEREKIEQHLVVTTDGEKYMCYAGEVEYLEADYQELKKERDELRELVNIQYQNNLKIIAKLDIVLTRIKGGE